MTECKLTCDMTDEEFVAHVRDKCKLTISNTAAGVYMDGLATRLLKLRQWYGEVEEDNAHLRKSIKDWAGISCITGRHRSCDCPACKRLLEAAINSND
jgi:hypothetical protein